MRGAVEYRLQTVERAAHVVGAEGQEQGGDGVDTGLGVLRGDVPVERLEVRADGDDHVVAAAALFGQQPVQVPRGSASWSGLRLKVCHPWPARATRARAASLSPPMWMGGCGCCTGFGNIEHGSSE